MGGMGNDAIRTVGVIDIGKTNAKVALVDLQTEEEVRVVKRTNDVLNTLPYPHYDIDGLWDFFLKGLSELNADHHLEAISVTAHGASLALLDGSGGLATPVLDYEFDGPDSLAAAYDRIRPDFCETGSPRLPLGLNAGAQLHWQLETVDGLRNRLATVMTYPQYWGYRLTGVAANEVTSLGCHTDLWCPQAQTFSSLVKTLGLEGRMAPVCKAGTLLGGITLEVARATGLGEGLPVVCGIHDSNASLYPHLLKRRTPFSVVSTGTWVVVLSVAGQTTNLDPFRDTVMNVNAFGDPVPSARFMGGREFDLVMDGRAPRFEASDVNEVLAQSIMLFPSVESRSGPFQGREFFWSTDERTLSDGQRFVALSYYLALMTQECLELSGADGPIVVEGPFAQNSLYRDMLEAISGRPVMAEGGAVTGTSVGAALLLKSPGRYCEEAGERAEPLVVPDQRLVSYGRHWREAVQQGDSTRQAAAL